MNKNVLLTGGTGFVGRQIIEALIEKGCTVRIVVQKGKEDAIPLGIKEDNIVFTKDLFSEPEEVMVSWCKGIDTLIHAAWYVEPGKYLQSNVNIDCLQGTLNLAKAAIKAGVKRFIGIGTCFEYDLSSGILSIDTPLKPTTIYSASKAATYFCLANLLPANSLEFVWCRLFYLYGEGEDERRLVPYIRSKLAVGEIAELTSGKQIRDFLDVKQAGRMIAEVSLSDKQGPVNICSGTPLTVRQLAETIADEYGKRHLLKFGVRPDNLVDPPCVLGICNLP